ncbi:MAG: radical SAM protein [Polyangiaceae bacterium]|nr:radical SAM protein [Polyangiaceae bacterium]
MSGRVEELLLEPPGCRLRCAGCECRTPSSGRPRALPEGAERVVVHPRGAGGAAVLAAVRRAREAGARTIVIRRSGQELVDEAGALRAAGATGALVPIHAHRPDVHDRVAGVPGALVSSLLGLRAAAAAGLATELEITLLPQRLQDVAAIGELALRAVPELRSLSPRLARHRLPDALVPSFGEVAGALRAAAAWTAARGVELDLGGGAGIPPCALAGSAETLAAFPLPARARRASALRTRPAAPCGGCALRARCEGLPAEILRVHGPGSAKPFERVPRELRAGARAAPVDVEAARAVDFVVLRPTVHCNQDCVFCSANETSRNVWASPDELLRRLAREARRGVSRVSFSGGEPTLSPHLPALLDASRRLGIPKREVVTNGVLLDREERVSRLVDAGLTHAFVSLHAHDEATSATLTLKRGDWARTVRAIELLIDRDVATVVNHVVCASNHRHLVQLVELCRERFHGRVLLDLAYVTPQYRALEHLDLVPRFSDAVPDVRRAIARAIELGQPINVGARQGIPPCLLGAHAAWSDAFHNVAEAASEDASQKTKPSSCARCRFDTICQGVWRPYAELFGTGELSPVEGTPIGAREREELRERGRERPWGVPRDLDDVPAWLRVPEPALGRATAPAPPRRLPVVVGRSRPVRLLLVGAGRRAERLARAVDALPALVVEAVASPGAPRRSTAQFGGGPAFSDVGAAIDALRPEAVVCAAATASHEEIARVVRAAGLPLLLEKPLAATPEESARLLAEWRREPGAPALLPGHNLVFAPGLLALLQERPTRVRIEARVPARAPEAPRAWSRAGLREWLHHLFSVAAFGLGEEAQTIEVESHHGDDRPRALRFVATSASRGVTLACDFEAPAAGLWVEAPGVGRWSREGAAHSLELHGVRREVPRAGSDVEGLVAHFGEVVTGGAAALAAEDAVGAQRAAWQAVDALERAGAPFDRAGRPKHAASPELRERSGGVGSAGRAASLADRGPDDRAR